MSYQSPNPSCPIGTAIKLASELQKHVGLGALSRPLKIEPTPATNSFYTIACQLYVIDKGAIASSSETTSSPIPLVEALHCLLYFSLVTLFCHW